MAAHGGPEAAVVARVDAFVTEPITKADLDRWEAMANAATPGEWRADIDPDMGREGDARVCYVRDGEACEWCVALAGETVDGKGERWTPETLARWRADAEFIAESRGAVPRKIARLRHLEWINGHTMDKREVEGYAGETMTITTLTPPKIDWLNTRGEP